MQTVQPIDSEVRKTSLADGGVELELLVDGKVVARASATRTALDNMRDTLGVEEKSILESLRDALLATLTLPGQFVEISDIKEEPGRPLRFNGRFTHRVRDRVSSGVVSYDVNTSATEPRDLPAVILNKMRTEVHHRLTSEGSTARRLVDNGNEGD
jgi:hypothetical protein